MLQLVVRTSDFVIVGLRLAHQKCCCLSIERVCGVGIQEQLR